MRFYSTCLLVTGVAVLALTSGAVFATVAGTDHDFSGESWNSSGEICLPCHTPHHAQSDIGPLWNHTVGTVADYTMYVEGTVLDNESLMCLGCHDGQFAVDSFGANPTSTEFIDGSELIGTDLTDDHPVGIAYPTGPTFAPIGTIGGTQAGIPIGGGGLPLYGVDGTIECATCHTAHSNTNDGFLRVSNAASALCTACHITH